MSVKWLINVGAAVLMKEDETRTYDADGPEYTRIVELISKKDYASLEELVAGMKKAIERIYDGFRVENDIVFVGDEALPNVLGRRLKGMADKNLNYKFLLNFWERVKLNQSFRVRNNLFECLDKNHHPFYNDDSGRYIGYKAIRNNWTDKKTGTIDNSIGAKPKIHRHEVDDDHSHDCSYGLHVGSWKYVQGFAQNDDRIVRVIVDPANVVTVPPEENYMKLRVCEYEVLDEMDRNSNEPTEQVYNEDKEIADFNRNHPQTVNDPIDDDDYLDDSWTEEDNGHPGYCTCYQCN